MDLSGWAIGIVCFIGAMSIICCFTYYTVLAIQVERKEAELKIERDHIRKVHELERNLRHDEA